MKLSDKEILTLINDERSAEKGLRVLMETYQSRLYWHIRRLIVDHSLAQDILQDTFIKAYQNIKQFNQESKIYTWLYRIATNEALQQLQKIKKMQPADQQAEYYLQNQVEDCSVGNAEDIQVMLQKAIQSLPEKQKLVFSMRYYDELAYEEMSKILDMSVGTLKTNYHYAKQKVEDYIKEHLETL